MCNVIRKSLCLFLLAGIALLNWKAWAQSPVHFIENKNQWPREVFFQAAIPGGFMRTGRGTFSYYFFDTQQLDERHHAGHLRDPDAAGNAPESLRGHAVNVHFSGADPNATPLGLGKRSQYYNYFIGSDQGRWASFAHAYDGMLYPSLYPGIDLKVYTTGANVKYDLVVAPSGNPDAIRISYAGADSVFLDGDNLRIVTPLASITEMKPFAYQVIEGEKSGVPCLFRLDGNEVSFVFPRGYDPCYELVIDPLLIFSTYSGSTADNWGSTATPGEHGNLYSAGVTHQGAGGTFPATSGAFQTTSGGLFDIGILKYDSLGSRLLYATYLGGNNSESPHSLIMNGAGELIVLGTTSSSNFATTAGAFQTRFGGGNATNHVVDYTAGSDIILSRLSPDGSRLLASTYVGGTANDGLNPSGGELTRNYGDQLRGDVITDTDGNIYVSSVTASPDFPLHTGFQVTYQGGATDAILFTMDAALSRVRWGTFLGGAGTDAAHTLKLDADRNIFLAGGTSSTNFPATAGSYQPVLSGGVDGWIAKVAHDGAALLQATFTGTTSYDQVYFLDLNASEEVYIYGQTAGRFPVTPGVYFNANSGQFIQKLDNTLTTRLFSTVFGAGRGEPDISPTAFLVNDCNNLYMAGWGGVVNSANGYWRGGTEGMTTTPDAFQLNSSGSDFYFIVLTDDATERLYATFLGGTLSRTHVDGGTSRFDKGGIVYHSVCSGCAAFNAVAPPRPTSDFPTTPGAWSNTNRSNNCNNAAFKFDLSSLKARLQTNTPGRDRPGIRIVCIPEPLVFENLSTGGELFEWDLGDGTTVSKTDTTFVLHHYREPGKYLVRLKAIDYGTCQVMDETSVMVTVNIAMSQVQDDASVCEGDSYQLRASGGATYHWTSPAIGFESAEASPWVTPPDTVAVFLTLTEVNGCVRKDTVVLHVVPAIRPEFEWFKRAGCETRPEIAVKNKTDSLKAGDLMFFDYGDGAVSDQDEDLHGFETDGVFAVRLVGRREFCVYEKAVSIPVFQFYIPNVITPGSPAFNDVFTIRFGQTGDQTPADYGFRVMLTIVDRWGRPVYQTDDYRYDWSGDDLNAGIYFYEVTIEGHTTCKSWLHLVK